MLIYAVIQARGWKNCPKSKHQAETKSRANEKLWGQFFQPRDCYHSIQHILRKHFIILKFNNIFSPRQQSSGQCHQFKCTWYCTIFYYVIILNTTHDWSLHLYEAEITWKYRELADNSNTFRTRSTGSSRIIQKKRKILPEILFNCGNWSWRVTKSWYKINL